MNEVLISNCEVCVSVRDNELIFLMKWEELCKKLVKCFMICYKCELVCIVVFGFKKDVIDVVKRMRDFFNEKKVIEGEIRFII